MSVHKFGNTAVRATLAGLFFLANSGFTLVLRECTAAPMTCCCPACDHGSCGNRVQENGPAHAITSSVSHGSCHTTVIAGGLSDHPLIQDGPTWLRVHKVAQTLDLALSPAGGSVLPASSYPVVSSLEGAVTPSVEKCVLLSTFQI